MTSEKDKHVVGLGTVGADSIRLNRVLEMMTEMSKKVSEIKEMTASIYDELKTKTVIKMVDVPEQEQPQKKPVDEIMYDQYNVNQYNILESLEDLSKDDAKTDFDIFVHSSFSSSSSSSSCLTKQTTTKEYESSMDAEDKILVTEMESDNIKVEPIANEQNSKTVKTPSMSKHEQTKKKIRIFDKKKKMVFDQTLLECEQTLTKCTEIVSKMLTENYNFTEESFWSSYVTPKYTDVGVGTKFDLNFHPANSNVFYNGSEYLSAVSSSQNPNE